MKFSSIIAKLVLTLSTFLLKNALGCSCSSFPSVENALFNPAIDFVFRGHVVRLLKGDDSGIVDYDNIDLSAQNYYSVRVIRVFKGCTFVNATTVIVTTDRNTFCGVKLTPDENLILSGRARAPNDPDVFKLIRGKNITLHSSEVVSINNCDYRGRFKSAPGAEKIMLRNFTNICTKCTSAADCPGGIGGNFYCDQGKCMNINHPCPPLDPWFTMPPCLDDPCLMTQPCAGAKCIPDKCDTCAPPLWIDPQGNRVCH